MTQQLLPLRLLASLVLTASAAAQAPIPPDTITTVVDGDSIPGMGAVGGVTIDGLGYVYFADFRNRVWRYEPGGQVSLYADGLYGSSGNAIGPRGELYQSSFNGHTVSRIDRDGRLSTVADTGLNGPVGIAVGPERELYVVNCTGSTVSRITADGAVHPFAASPLFACPNGITRDDRGDLYVVNYGNTQVVRITPDGTASLFADIPGAGGNGHITFGNDGFYVTKLRAHQVYRLERDGSSTVIAGTGTQGQRDGPALQAQLSQPNGIAISANGTELWVNELVSGNGVGGGVARSTLRRIRLVGLGDVLAQASPNDGSVARAYRAYRDARPKASTTAAAIAAGYGFLQGGRLQDAAAVFTANAADHPRDANSHFHLGEFHRHTRNPRAAAEAYRQVLAIDPDHAAANARLAAVTSEK